MADSEQGETFQEALVRLASEWRAREQETKCPDVVLNVYDMVCYFAAMPTQLPR